MLLVCSASLSGLSYCAATKGGAEQGRKTVSFGEQTDVVAWIELIAQPKRPKQSNDVMREREKVETRTASRAPLSRQPEQGLLFDSTPASLCEPVFRLDILQTRQSWCSLSYFGSQNTSSQAECHAGYCMTLA
ncbi:uncharacterized protein UHOD_05363 [Ustilago sp. UG-2017b]|nr:uncharacterized protein UHOD_05363 [Ustilago sp. UG-2017b]